MMDTGQKDEGQTLPIKLSGIAAYSSRIGSIVFALIGILITVLAYSSLNVFVQGTLQSEYQKEADAISSHIEHKASLLLSPLEIMATGVSVSSADLAGVNGRTLEPFDSIYLITGHASGSSQIEMIYSAADRDFLYGARPQRAVYSLADMHAFQRQLAREEQYTGSRPGIYFQKEMFHLERGSASKQEDAAARKFGGVPAFALARSFLRPSGERGTVLAVIQSARLIDPAWVEARTGISRLEIVTASDGATIFSCGESTQPRWYLPSYFKSSVFPLDGLDFNIRVEFGSDQKIVFMMLAPYALLLFGLTLTVFGMFYIHSSQQQSLQTRTLNTVLADKNAALQNEIKRRERLNKTLKRKERENRAIVDSVSDIIFETDTEGKILFLNQTWQRLTGFEIEQSLGLDLFKVLHPQDKERHYKDFQMMVRGQKESYRAFTRLRMIDGSFRAVEMAMSMLRRDEARNLRVVGSFIDIEDRRRAEFALSEAEKKYRTIVEHTAGGIFQLTPEGQYLSVNPAFAKILGYDGPDEVLRMVRNAHETVYHNHKDRHGFLRELERRDTIPNYEVQMVRKSGEKIWVNENIRVVRDESGNTLYYEGSIEDITKRKEADIALREAKVNSDLANRAKSEFLANMSHELRTPLNAIIGFSDIIKNEAFGEVGHKVYKEYAADIHDSGKNLLTIINEILDISKIEAGERQLNEGVINMKALVGSCLSMLNVKAKTNNLIITHTLDDMPDLIGEEIALKQVLINLLSNAIKFTPNGGRITMTHETDADGSLRLCVTDTGVGLDEEEVNRAMAPFGHAGKASSRDSTGTGLGLTLVHSLLALHGARMEIFSQKGIGTTASIIFPAQRVAKPPAGQSGEAPKAAGAKPDAIDLKSVLAKKPAAAEKQ